VAGSTDTALDVGFHQHLHYRLRRPAQESRIAGFGQQISQ
jgi:hypothetical protein